jgi:uncharacterized phage infection (PIP) family protein YhgE
MKTILTICFILTIAIGIAATHSRADDYTSLDNRIRKLKGSIEVQIERIKSAREKSDTEMGLARIRLAEQLRRSEEDLYRQAAALERFHEQLADQVTEVKSAVVGYQRNWKSPMQQALTEIETQLQSTNALMTQMETARNNLESGPQGGQDVSRSSGTVLRGASGCEPSVSSSATAALPDLQLSAQSKTSSRASRQTPSKAPCASDISEPEVQVTSPDTPSTAPGATEHPPSTEPATPKTRGG